MNILVNNIMTSYSDTGKGKIVLLLHGWGSNRQNFEVLTEFFAKKYRVISLDFPGFGGTMEQPHTWHMANYAQFVEDFLVKLNIKEIEIVLGHSFGGRVILKSHGLGAKRIIFMDSAGVKPNKSVKQKILIPLAKVAKHLPGTRKLANKFGSEDYRKLNGIMRETFRNVIDEDLVGEMKNISVPTLIVWGADDDDTPISDAQIFNAQIKNSTLKIVENAGHYAWIDQPEKVKNIIKEWI